MSDTKKQTDLAALLDAMSAFYANEGNLAGSINIDEALAAIQSAIADAIPEAIDTPGGAFAKGYNQAIIEFSSNLRAKGLLR